MTNGERRIKAQQLREIAKLIEEKARQLEEGTGT